jgi:hypothetical protein
MRYSIYLNGFDLKLPVRAVGVPECRYFPSSSELSPENCCFWSARAEPANLFKVIYTSPGAQVLGTKSVRPT